MLHVLSFGRNVENMSSLDTDKVCYLETNMKRDEITFFFNQCSAWQSTETR